VPSETPQITCRRFVKSLSAWHDGELAGAARASFEAHRAGCTRCARYATAFKAAITLMKSALADSAAHAELPEDLTQAILAPCRESN
jgi:anti-sigma factor RsiW